MSDESMTIWASAQKFRIARTVRPSHHGNRTAKFETEDGFFICEAWFERGEPRMQIRSGVRGLEEAAVVGTGIQMMMAWIVDEMESPDFEAAL